MIVEQKARRAVWQPLFQLPRRADLILPLVRRDLIARYRGSALGVLWVLLTPLVMIAIFTFIFAGIFGARFGEQSSGTWDYALYLFCGLLPWTAFQEAVQLAAGVIVANTNLVKRVVFPLETLPLAQTFASVINQLFGTVALLLAALLIRREIHLTTLWLPVLLVPQIVATLGAAWFIASLGVFLRDTAQAVTLLLMAWLYLTPIIYPESVVPEKYRPFINANPFTALIRCYRNVLLDGTSPDWRGLAYFSIFALVLFVGGYWWFARTRKNFADVI
jgi:lipopolysaccharide transport system permease protein